MTFAPTRREPFDLAPRVEIDPGRPLIVVAPHPDDEVIGFGGALFDHAAAGGVAVIVSITDGEAYDPCAAGSERRGAATRRRKEQVEALMLLGIDPRAVVRLGVPDGGVADHEQEIAEVLRGLLAAMAPTGEALVVAPWNADCHPDHEATTRAVHVGGTADLLEVPIWSWFRRSEIEPQWRELSVVPISHAARKAKRAALRCHRSQLTSLPGGRPPILSSTFLEDFDRTVEVVVR